MSPLSSRDATAKIDHLDEMRTRSHRPRAPGSTLYEVTGGRGERRVEVAAAGRVTPPAPAPTRSRRRDRDDGADSAIEGLRASRRGRTVEADDVVDVRADHLVIARRRRRRACEMAQAYAAGLEHDLDRARVRLFARRGHQPAGFRPRTGWSRRRRRPAGGLAGSRGSSTPRPESHRRFSPTAQRSRPTRSRRARPAALPAMTLDWRPSASSPAAAFEVDESMQVANVSGGGSTPPADRTSEPADHIGEYRTVSAT